ncbi:uncharacterized protein EI90DRAFT_3072374 [Cantharellus anzutake]|uniref:uncharacterized protein n=1 Tax=Cantharellus anzutake TaxID=1750568 RepID=UPI0019051318|nr:uncharacterized protein EI90DRAFT_3072374 [Cantharellus anzutake]KAF8325649.1 hypothetical protein EI90DRAFT_3072374 [Cantharellus anzutake]
MSWNPSPAVSQADIDLLTNLNRHLLHAAAISRSIALRWGVKPLDPEALGLGSFDRQEHDRLPRAAYPHRPYPIAPPPDGPSLESTRQTDGRNVPTHNTHPWRHSPSIPHSGEAPGDALVPSRQRSSEHPSSVPSPSPLPEMESDRTIEARPSRNHKPNTFTNEDEDMSLDEMILNVADGDEPTGGKTSKKSHRNNPILMIEAPGPRHQSSSSAVARDSADRRKNRNNSNQHGQLRAIAHRIPQPIGDPLPPDQPSRTRESSPSLLAYPSSTVPISDTGSTALHISTLDYRFSAGTGHVSAHLAIPPSMETPYGLRSAQVGNKDAHIAFAPLNGPDSMAAVVDLNRNAEAHHVRKPAPVNERTCSQCGRPGRLKDGRSVEKWGPGPEGPGTVCDRCRKKMKRDEKRSTADPALMVPNAVRLDAPAEPSCEPSYSLSPEIERSARHDAENGSLSLAYHPHPHPPHAAFSQPKPSFLSRDKDLIPNPLEDGRYSPSMNIQPVSDIRSESSVDHIHSRTTNDRERRSKGRDPGRIRRKAPSFSPSRSPSPHSILENSPPAPFSHKNSKFHSSPAAVDDASCLLEQELFQTASHPPDPRVQDGDFDSDSTTTQFRKDSQISPVGSTSDGTIVDASRGCSTAPQSVAPNGNFSVLQPEPSPTQGVGFPGSNAHVLASSTGSVLGKRRSPPDGESTVSDVERQRPKKGEILVGGVDNSMSQHLTQPDAHDILANTYASDEADTVR